MGNKGDKEKWFLCIHFVLIATKQTFVSSHPPCPQAGLQHKVTATYINLYHTIYTQIPTSNKHCEDTDQAAVQPWTLPHHWNMSTELLYATLSVNVVWPSIPSLPEGSKGDKMAQCIGGVNVIWTFHKKRNRICLAKHERASASHHKHHMGLA
jgi:hypothetical protein